MASIVVELPAPLRRSAGGCAELPAEGETVRAALALLRATHPAAARRFLADSDEPRRGVSLLLDGADVRGLGGLEAPLRDGARLSVVLLLAGG